MGGMGFLDLHLFNLALLGRQVWHLMSQRNTLCFKVLSAKYFPNGDVFNYKLGDKPSFTWNSIAKAVDALKDGFLWQIGNRETIDIRRDHWGIEGVKRKEACRSPLTNEKRKSKIYGTTTTSGGKKKGIGHNILPTFDNIARIRQGINNVCPRCKGTEEMLMHALKECLKAREILVAGGLNNGLLDGHYSNCIDWLEDMFHELDSKAAANFLTLFWNSWNDRNNMVFKGEMDEAVMI
ncbi:hypothetical protein J1N35_037496 [Gossypium stocksii]|uniref:Reverse transcriptase n=1 Tax=Gossypium stocksii TaxID=47602 RepID=A0A9D3ZLU9_9ROSI|nr:hypothetical protein J1N35_037496 [Gossypium stocksii]